MNFSVSFIGSGRVATQLAHVLSQHVTIRQVFSRDLKHAEQLAKNVNAQAINQLKQLHAVDLLIIAVSDQVIAEIAKNLAQQHYTGFVVHTSGSTDLYVLKQHGLQAGVFYPLQTFSFEKAVNWQDTPIFIEASRNEDVETLEQLAKLLSKSVYQYTSQQRLSLHLAAVFACNFSNYCYDIAQQILNQNHVDSALLQPLILETTHKLQFFSAFQNQTGPAKRHDQNILDLHQHLLKDQSEWQRIYQIMSDGIKKRHD